jgi:Tol biopolymer transport system component/DNA-binding winged helix-turn-helix (wHTH) protein
MSSSRNLRYRFGPWEVSPDLLELRKHGIKIKLREQPFKVLIALLENPGKLISREDLRKLLWAGDTFVDFDKGLNTAMNNLRQILNDSAVEPRYIETVPKHGYRFIAAVARVEETADSKTEQEAPAEPLIEAAVEPPPRRRLGVLLAVAGLICAAGFALLPNLPFRANSHKSSNGTLRVRPLTSYAGVETSPSFSPDGAQFVFAYRAPGRSESDICLQMTDGTHFVKIAATGDDELSPAWSPDGSVIAYLRRASDFQMDVMLVPPKPGELPRKIAAISYPPLPNLNYQNDLLSWAPDSKFVYVPDAGSTGQTAIRRVEVTTGQTIQVTQPQSRKSHSYPRINPDGRWLALQEVGGEHRTQVLVMPLSKEGLPAGPFIPVTHGLVASPLGWIRDELLVVRADAALDIQRWKLSSRQMEKLSIPELTGPGMRVSSGAVSADGRRLAIASSRLDVDIWQLEISDRGEPLPAHALIDSTYLDLSADWSRDGRQLLFKSTRSGSHEAWMADSDGSHIRQLTRVGGLGDPRLSPDGKEFVFNRGEGGSPDIFVADVETGTPRLLAPHPAEDTNARWSRDGKYIYFDSDRSGRPEIWKVSRAGGEPVRVTRNGGSNAFESADGRYLYYGRDRHVWRMQVEGGVEEKLFESPIDWASLAMGTRFMYFTGGNSGVTNFGTDIYSYELATGRVRRLWATGNAVVTLAASPDDRRLAYGRLQDPQSDLMLVELAAR